MSVLLRRRSRGRGWWSLPEGLALASLIGLMAAAGCGASPPRISLADAHLVEEPVLVRRADGYVLRYRFPVPDGTPAFAVSVFVRRTPDAAYYYFAGVLQSSVLERGRIVERRLAEDGLEDLARAERVFWLDPDGTTHAIPVRAETR